ncbi:MAG: asparagine synthase (glutamine-hydrolyzing) [Bacteroidia bacterium]|nr:asparagine synthase (glutamine-hydrolyzing) [Bacteroidia bacterium]MDW8302622.1 asparagine synthase (glutamine-hydrolyzing) [Bacteroidia bacterium]
MCGITGIISTQNPVQVQQIKAMNDTLIHRGPDSEGIWISKDGKIGLGHRRLSILDLSERGAQPMHSKDGNYVIVLNGEIYNYIELREILTKKGYTFNSQTDTEVLLNLFIEYGEACLKQVEGMYAFAIWNNKDKTLFLARDRFGEKPLYYTYTTHSFAFASEMKALWKYGVSKKPNLKRVFEYLLYSTIESSIYPYQTFYENIFQIEPAHYAYVRIDQDRLHFQTHKYWDITNINATYTGSFEQAKEEFLALFTDSIRKRLRSDVPVGSSLSGGLDSSSIVCSIHQYFSNNIKEFQTFSAVFPGFELDESKYIQAVAQKTGFKANYVTPDSNSFIKNIDKINYHQEEPYGSASIAAQYEVMQMVKQQQVTVLLDGQGADEMLAGYTPLWQTYLKHLLFTRPLAFHKEWREFKKIPNFKLEGSFGFNLLNQWFYTLKKKLSVFKRKFISVKSPYYLGIHPDIVKKYRLLPSPIESPPTLKEHLYFMLLKRGLNELLRYADRNSMAHAVEVRLPFLDHRIAEFLFSLPDNYLISPGYSKRILRAAMQGILPDLIIQRQDKIGFAPPQQEWFNNPKLKEMVYSSIEKLKKEGVIVKSYPQLYWQYLMLGYTYQS